MSIYDLQDHSGFEFKFDLFSLDMKKQSLGISFNIGLIFPSRF